VLERLPGDAYAKGIANGEVTGSELAGMMVLRKEDRFVGAVDRLPVGDASFERSPCGVLELAGIPPPQIVEQCLCSQPRFSLEHLLNFVPHVGKRVDASSVIAGRFSL